MSCTNCQETTKFDYTKLDDFINTLKYKDSSDLIETLHYAQNLYGYLDEEIQHHIAKKLNVSIAQVYGVITFYSYFTDKPKGKYKVQVCIGTGCFVKGSDDVLKKFEKKLKIDTGETTEDMMFTLEGVRCVGACGLAPVVIINEKVYGHVNPDSVEEIIENYLIDEI